MNQKIRISNSQLAEIQSVAKSLQNVQDLVLTTHINPDADAIGSTCALALALATLGKKPRVINTSPTPENLQFMAGTSMIEVFDEAVHTKLLQETELIVCLDLNVPQRTGGLASLISERKASVMMIDHHADPADFYSTHLHDVEATSTAELVYKLLAYSFPQTLNADISTNLYAGIMADSGNFRFPRVCADTHYIIAELIEYGADPVAIYDTMYNSWSIDRTRLNAEIVASMTLHCDGRFCAMIVPKELYRRHNCTEDAVESAVQQTLSIRGVRCGVLIAERESSDEVKISLRSKAEFRVNGIAATFGGGGHIYAAGARAKNSTLAQVFERVLAEVSEQFRVLDSQK